jgi:3D (Asp-Asp-Asp) domain-containing protein
MTDKKMKGGFEVKNKEKIVFFIVSIALVILLILCKNLAYQSIDKITILENQIKEKNKMVDDLLNQVKQQDMKINNLQEEIKNSRKEIVSRGETSVKMNVTAYNESYECCGKKKDDPLYGITASGQKVKEWYTVAAGSELMFGTKIYIPYFQDKPNNGIFTVTDRGVARGCIDVYMPAYEDCVDFGRRKLEVYVLKRGDKD